MEIATKVAGIPCIARVSHYAPHRDNRRGHIDTWLPDDPEEIEFEICDRRGRPAPWLARKMTPQEADRITSQLLERNHD